MTHHHSQFGEGVDAGFLGGVAVASWFFLRDLLAGHPLVTPSILGQVFLLGEEHPAMTPLFGPIVMYTVVHFVAFALFGVLVAWLVRLAVNQPVFRFALVMLFVTFEVFFYVVIHAVSDAVGALFPFWLVASANLLAAAVMGAYFWRKHPALRRALKREPLGA
jgi:hypothetical protein